MNKKKLDDFKISTKKIIRGAEEPIVVQSNANPSSKYDFLNKKKPSPVSTQRIHQTPVMPSGKRSFNKTILLFFIISALIGIIYLFSNVLLRVNIAIVPKTKTFDSVSEKFTASKKGNVPFEVMIEEDSVYKDVVLTTSMDVSDKAKGEITLANEYSNKAEKIPVGSLIADEKGKTYKTDVAVSIPGYTQNKAKVITPGKVNVGITAFLPGEVYNGSPVSFYINSYKGTAKYKKIYGTLKTPLTGGMVGTVYTMDDKEKESILANSSLFKDELLRKLNASVPPGYILYPNAVNFTYGFGDNVTSKTPNLKLEIKSNLSAFLVKKSDLSDSLIKKLLPDVSEKEYLEIVVPDLSALSFDFVNKDQVISKDIENFDFNLSGKISINWKPGIEQLKDSITGKTKDEVLSIFKNDPGILRASVKIIPFWSKKLPTDKKAINIVLN